MSRPAQVLDRYAVLGNPVAHSQSPFIHGEFARATGQAMAYGRVLSPIDAFEPVLHAFAAGGGCGANITMPFKLQACALAQEVSARAQLAGAANVLRLGDGHWFADNTDGVGLVRDIQIHAGYSLAGQRVLLVGAGGAAAGALGPLLHEGPAELVLANRTPAKASELAQRHQALAKAHGVALRASSLEEAGQAFDIVINSSASSLQGQGSPVGAQVLRPGSLALDMMYGPAAQPFTAWAERHGATARDGLGMLVEQAAEAFFIFRGVRPATAKVLASLRQRLDAAAQQQQ